MGQYYSHLSVSERTLIYWWLKDKISIREMARRLKRDHSSISRELRRNKWFNNPNYFPRGAQQLYHWRLQQRATRYRLKKPSLRNYVIHRLQCGWTPEIIAGRLKHAGNGLSICHKAIYQFIYKEAPELRVCLPRAHLHRRTKQPYRTKPCRIKNQFSCINALVMPTIENALAIGRATRLNLLVASRDSMY